MILTLLACLIAQDTIPPGFGTLRRDDVVMRMSTGTIEVQILPLDEQLIRLLAPDTYRSLTQLEQSRAAEIADAAARGSTPNPTLVMVTFLGVVSAARFNPEDVNITSRGRLFRPVGIVPLSPTWGSYQLDARQQAAAIYLFEPGISLREQLTVSYQGLSSEAWTRSLRLLDQERARVKARAQLEAKPDSAAPPRRPPHARRIRAHHADLPALETRRQCQCAVTSQRKERAGPGRCFERVGRERGDGAMRSHHGAQRANLQLHVREHVQRVVRIRNPHGALGRRSDPEEQPAQVEQRAIGHARQRGRGEIEHVAVPHVPPFRLHSEILALGGPKPPQRRTDRRRIDGACRIPQPLHRRAQRGRVATPGGDAQRRPHHVPRLRQGGRARARAAGDPNGTGCDKQANRRQLHSVMYIAVAKRSDSPLTSAAVDIASASQATPATIVTWRRVATGRPWAGSITCPNTSRPSWMTD